jgi:uncharacterized Zn-binding protein involved in type VI secretion
MPPAARVTDMHVCPMVNVLVPHVGGPILPPCMPTVLIGGLPAARISDLCTCVGPPDVIVTGAFTVLIGGMPAARIGDMTAHGGTIVMGQFNVLIGDAGGGSGYMGGGAGAGEGGGIDAGEGAAGMLTHAKASSSSSAASKQAQALKQAAKDGVPFCELCNQ